MEFPCVPSLNNKWLPASAVGSYMTGDHPEADSRTRFKLRLAERFIDGARRGSLGYSK